VEAALTFALVAAAALYLGARAWRTFRPRSAAGGGCGCAGAKAGCPATADMAERIRAAARGVAPRS
jgi:hypothetical protein